MNIWQQRQQEEKETRRFLKKCPTALAQVKFGFKPPVINGMGKCSGCYNPDDGQMESQCRGCRFNEYFIEEVGA